MQADLRWLLAGLGLGASSLVALGCDEPKQTAPTSTVTAVPIGSDGERIHPPEGKWCAKPEIAKGLVILGSPEVDGCAKFLDGARIPKEKELAPEYIEMPRSTYGFYDDIQTKMRRSAINHAPLCCYNWREKTPGGRPLVERAAEGVAVVAPLVSEELGATLQALSLEAPPASEAARIFEHWQRQAQLEHASVASFARARLELLALGAPRDLVQRYTQAAREELFHTQLALSVLRAWGAPPLSLGRLALPGAAVAPTVGSRKVAIAQLAQRTLDEAFEPEAAAALALHQAAGRAACPNLREILSRIAADERRHARLALETVIWCRRESIRARPQLTRSPVARESLLVEADCARSWGVISPADWAAARARCHAPLAEALRAAHA